MKPGYLGLLLIILVYLLVQSSVPGETGNNKTTGEDIFHLLRIEPYVDGFSQVSHITHAGDERLFVTQLHGEILIIDEAGILEPEPFLDIRDQIFWGFGETGLVSLAFHPDYAENGYFFVVYTNLNKDSVVSRFQVSSDPNIADRNSEEIIIILPQPSIIHNIGQLSFGPDGYLYIAVGDGGPLSDLNHQGQNRQSLYGSLLRIDVSSEFPYAIPPDNPFVGDAGARNEIFHYGLRNPWRFTFDALTNDLYIGDVGEQRFEEINRFSAGDMAGQNLGWSCYEGSDIFNSAQCDETNEYTFPIFTYSHDSGCAIILGPMYRGTVYPELQEHILFTDYCTGTLSAISPDPQGEWRIAYTSSTGLDVWTSFGVDIHGEMYLGRYGPNIYRIGLIAVNLPAKHYLPNIQWSRPVVETMYH